MLSAVVAIGVASFAIEEYAAATEGIPQAWAAPRPTLAEAQAFINTAHTAQHTAHTAQADLEALDIATQRAG